MAALTEDSHAAESDIARVGEALTGLLQVNPFDKDGNHTAIDEKGRERPFVYVQSWEDGPEEISPIDYSCEWGEFVDEHNGDVAAAVLHHLRGVVELHQKTLDQVTQRLRENGLIS